MKRKLYIALFFIICMIPSVGMLVLDPSDAAANERLSRLPSVTNSDGSFNMDLLSDIDDYISDHFAFRQELITLDHHLCAAVLGESGSDEVILGKDGMLFYSETLDDYEGTNIFTKRQLWCASRSLSLMNEYCNSMGIDFLFTVAPNKNSVYPEYMPERFPQNQGQHNVDMLYDELDILGIKYLDLSDIISSSDVLLYRYGDSHWTQQGAAIAADAINKILGHNNKSFADMSYVESASAIGDLYEMLYPSDKDHLDVDMAPIDALSFEYKKPIRDASDNRIDTSCSNAQENLVMYRDSFGNALHRYMAESFQSAIFSRISPYDFSLIEKGTTNTVIIELVERNLDWLITKAALMPAPKKTPDLDYDTDSKLDISEFSVMGTDVFDDCIIVSGRINDADLDFDSPIYIAVAGELYEAFPQDRGGFYACICTEHSDATSFEIIAKCGGEYIISSFNLW